MSVSISGLSPVTPGVVAVAAVSSGIPETEQSSVAVSSDHVNLSVQSQVELLRQEGQSPSEIAASMPMPAANVDRLLGISMAAQTVVQPPSQISVLG